MNRTIVEKSSDNLIVMDVYSKLSESRIVFIDDVITSKLCNSLIAQLLYLDASNSEDIHIYINTPGGDVYAGLALFDVIKRLRSKVIITALGICASMGFILLLSSPHRTALKHTKFMIHEVSGGSVGTVSDIKITSKEMENLWEDLYEILQSELSLPYSKEELSKDRWFNTEEAKNIGLIKSVL